MKRSKIRTPGKNKDCKKKSKTYSLRVSIIKIFLMLFVSSQVILSFFIIFSLNNMTKKQVEDFKATDIGNVKNLLLDTTNIAVNTVNKLYDEFKDEELKLISSGAKRSYIKEVEEKYKNEALSILKTFRFSGVNGYFYVYTYDGINIAHPIQPNLEGTNLWGMKDRNGVMVIQELISAAKNGGGFVDFVWNKPGVGKEVDKIGYAAGFESWKWMIGTGLYIDDIERDVKDYIKKGYSQVLSILFIFCLISALFILIFIVTTFFFVKKIISAPLNDLISKAQTISAGDLTVVFESKQKNELGNLVDAIETMVETLKNLNQKIYIAVSILTKNLRTLFKSSTVVKDSANTQAVTVEETLGNFENMNKMVDTISSESAKADNYAGQALNKAQVGMESMQKLEKEMLKIETSSQEITDIIGMINEIAEQTNLLSLNASIESARAGDAGKGFNIVAAEIRKLAEKSTQAANRIHKLITNNNAIIQEGVKYSKQTTNILKDISTSNELISGLVKTISEEIHKVKFSSEEILLAINHISNIAQDNLTESENVSIAMTDFVEQTLELQKFVGQFDVRDDKAKSNHKHIEELLKSKLIEASSILSEFGSTILPTGNTIVINQYKLNELQIGTTQITNSTLIVDAISKRIHASVTFFQPCDNELVRVATTVRDFDEKRAIGTAISNDSPIFKSVMSGNMYFGRAFVVNRWYVAVYKPLQDETGYVTGVLYLGLPENMAEDEKYSEQVGIVEDNTFNVEYIDDDNK